MAAAPPRGFSEIHLPQPRVAKVVSLSLESVLLKKHLNSGSGMGPIGLVPACCELRPHAPQSQDK